MSDAQLLSNAGPILGAIWITLMAVLACLVMLESRRNPAEPPTPEEPSFGICPGCEDFKPLPPSHVLCGECWAGLPFRLQARLVDSYLAKQDGAGAWLYIESMTLARLHLSDQRSTSHTAPQL